ncbi:hypothetical protein [Glutamicibacter arilaitensis]|uniref:Uncharacterized protein n=1 Tax=Glutamicibacter arilaitensis TaxID=256701 RepID=A0A4Y8U0K1_9MICC|nr:hypothetical protein [Glutamicibacter arilaitensis]TFH57289.1 hypothetical protein EXY26_09925 [Glutamicibacter arilaitensis]
MSESTSAHEATALNADTTPNIKHYVSNGANVLIEAELAAHHAGYQSTRKHRSTSGTPTTAPHTKAQNTATATAQTADAEGEPPNTEPVEKPVDNPHPGPPKQWSDQTAGEVALMREGFKYSQTRLHYLHCAGVLVSPQTAHRSSRVLVDR